MMGRCLPAIDIFHTTDVVGFQSASGRLHGKPETR